MTDAVTDTPPKVSVVIATYQPGAALERVVDSLAAQTMPQEDFEVVFVDDGSADGTFDRLQRIAAGRPNTRAYRIENSGWASRPRNVGIGHARGEYVMFMDHDDSLYPDGLERAYEYAKQNDADILSPKESKTNDSWWALAPQEDGNIPNALTDGGIARLMPMVPHKLYRRQLLLDHDIRFPEGARMLWEDIVVNVAAYRHAKVVSLLADTPVYLWHASDTNSSHTFDPARRDFWQRLEDLLKFVCSTLDTAEYREARDFIVAHQVRVRVIDRLARMNVRENRLRALEALARARRLLHKYATDDILALLPRKHQAQAHLLRSARPDRVWAFHSADLWQQSETCVRALGWRDGVLQALLECVWEPKSAERPTLRREGARIIREVGEDLERAVPRGYLDVTDDAATMKLDICMRSRTGYVAWNVPFAISAAGYEEGPDGLLRLVVRGTATVDLQTVAAGRPLGDNVWDFRTRSSWLGMARKGQLTYTGRVRPALSHGRGAVAYPTTTEALGLDVAGGLRTLALDARPCRGTAGPATAFAIPFANVAAFGQTRLETDDLVAVPDGAAGATTEPATEAAGSAAAGGASLHARIVADADGARLEGGAELGPGRYAVHARRRGELYPTNRAIVVDAEGQLTFE